MKKCTQLLVISMIVIIFLSACSMSETENNIKKIDSGNKIDIEFFTAEEKEKMGIQDDTSVELFSNPNLKNQYFVKVVTDVDWNEVLYRVTINGDKKSIETMQDGGPIVDDVSFYTQGELDLPDKYIPILLAVTTSTHMGNGNTTFYAFTQDGTMSLLLSTSPTVDREKDTTNGAIFENGRLSAYIRQSKNESEYSEIVFVGRVYIYGVKNNDTAGEYLYQIKDIEKVYSFNKDISQYEESSSKEDLIQTIDGVSSYTDFWREQVESASE